MASDDRRMTPGMVKRLRSKAAEFGDYAKVSQASGVPIGTLQKMMTGATDPRFATVVEVCRTIGISLDYVVTGLDFWSEEVGDWETRLGPPPIGEKRVPVRDISASAGHGEEVFYEDPPYWFTFPLDWLMSLGNPDELEILKVEGDSMEPDLRDGDHVMIDRSRRQLNDGLFVVDVDDRLFIKRVRVRGKERVDLVSTNPAYPAFEVLVPDEENDVAQVGAKIVGQVVWSGRIVR